MMPAIVGWCLHCALPAVAALLARWLLLRADANPAKSLPTEQPPALLPLLDWRRRE